MSDAMVDFLSSGGNPGEAQVNAYMNSQTAGKDPQAARMRILQQEKADQEKSGTVDPALDREISRTASTPTDPIVQFMSGGGTPGISEPKQTPQPIPNISQEGPGKTIAEGIPAVLDTAYNAIPGALSGVVYAGARAVGQTPEKATAIADTTTNWMTNPFGKAFGVVGTPGYNNEASKQIMNVISQYWDKGATWISQKVGLPKADVSNMMQTLSYAAPSIARASSGLLKNASGTLGKAAIETAEGDLPRTPAPVSLENVRSTYSAPEAMQPREMVGTGSAATASNPYPKFTGEEGVRGPFPQIKLAKSSGDVSLNEQRMRAGVSNDILGSENQSVRLGVVSGNENTLRNEYIAAKAPNPTPAEAVLRDQIAREQQALSRYAQERVDATGASPSLVNDAQRGEAINSALYGEEDSLLSYLKNAKAKIYDQARQEVGNNPIQTNHVDNLLSDPQFKAGVKLNNNEGVLNGAEELINLARENGFKSPVTGEILPAGSVAAWDAVRKSLNSGWTKDNASVIRQINSAIDRDVASAGGPGLYKAADAIHKAEKTILGSKGISNVFGEVDPNGVATGKPFEKIPKALNDMPIDQWRHIYDTMDMLSRGQVRGVPEGMPDVPQGIMDAATRAKAEIRGALARDVYEAGANKIGTWNQNSANKVLNSVVGQKILEAMPPDEVYKFHTLNYGGQMMPGVHSYEGAGLQTQRLAQQGWLEKHAPGMGAAVGSKAGPVGAVVGQKAGSFVGNLSRSSRETNQMNRLVDIMREASNKGRGQ